ncbi:RNA polymerase subunit AC19 [Blastocladiella emersonii ATCC 22665]|nr:RNA polymerase subunit AC19 [Blastocladiella emersonii ATCC 22665]
MADNMDVEVAQTDFVQRMSIIPIEGDEASSDTCCTFAIKEEDHTMGGILRYIMSRFPEVTFCGYSVPHPAEDEIHFRIETVEGTTPAEVLRKALDTIVNMSDHMMATFEQAIKDGKYEFVAEPDL